jgi:collagenase-like PrtC family protease
MYWWLRRGINATPADGRINHTKLMNDSTTNVWALPYIDQPLIFWNQLAENYTAQIREVFFPLKAEIIGSGRPQLPDQHLEEFIAHAPVPKAALLNAVTLPGPVERTAPAIIEELRRLRGEFGLVGATVANLRLAEEVRRAIPDLPLTASVLMEITQPNQALMLNGICDVLVPGARAMRHLPSLRTLKKAFHGKIRLLVNESCLSGCPYRQQHFHEMCTGVEEPHSLCDRLLEREPWMRLTGAWVVPQFLHHYDGAYDELKLAGRGTLQEADRFLEVFEAYVNRRPMLPCDIGGGPSSVMEPIEMPEELFVYTLHCGQRCHECRRCEEYYHEAVAQLESASSI